MLTEDRAKRIVQKKFPGYIVEWCVSYGDSFVVMAHQDDGPEDDVHGAYPDPFYLVNKRTGVIRKFSPVMEKDMGESFFEAVSKQLNA